MFPLAQKAILRSLSVRDLEKAVKAANRKSQTDTGMEVDGGVRVDYMAELEKRATSLIGRRVGIQSGKRKKILSIEFQDDADLEELLTKLCGSEIIE